MSLLQRLLVISGLVAISVAAGGCALFEAGGDMFGDRSSEAPGQSRGLPPIPTSRDAIHVEIMIAERPIGDSLLGEALWNEVDQVMSLAPQTRSALGRNGFLVGHAGSNPPRALEQLLGLKSEHAGAANGSAQKNLIGRRVVLSSGAETEVQASDLFPHCAVEITGPRGTETKEFENARFVFRLKVERAQEGWARLEFLPEIHHGAFQLRRVAGKNGWDFRTTQDVFPLYTQRFSLLLNEGEFAIVTAADGESPSVARHFFIARQPNMQRLLIVRLAGMTKSDPVYAR